MATARPIKAVRLLQWGEQVVMLCLSAVVPPPHLKSTHQPPCLCHHYVLLPPTAKQWLCAPKVSGKEGEESTQGCTLLHTAPAIDEGVSGGLLQLGSKNKH